MTTPAPQQGRTLTGAGTAFRTIQTLEQDERRLGLAFQRGNSFAFEWDVATDRITALSAGAQVFGIEEGTDITGELILSKVYPDDRDSLKAAFAGLTPERPHNHISCRIVHPDRGAIWLETSARAAFDSAGKMLRITGTVADSMANMSAVMEVFAANDWLRLAMEAGKSVGWDWDVKSGRDAWFGDLQTMFGIDSTTHVGHVDDFRRRVHPVDLSFIWKALQEAMQTRTSYMTEFRVVRPDGSVRWVAAQGKFYYSPEGETERMLGIAADITDRKTAEEALRRKEIELTEAQRLAGVGSWQWDVKNDIVVWRMSSIDSRAAIQNYLPSVTRNIPHFTHPKVGNGSTTRWRKRFGPARRMNSN